VTNVIDANRQQSLDILMDELLIDEELRASFFRSPAKTLRLAGDWGLPISDSEMQWLMSTDSSIWESVLEELDARLQEAA
jgi:hypothetical protein